MTAVQAGTFRLGDLFERHHRAVQLLPPPERRRPAGERSSGAGRPAHARYRATYRPGSQFRTWMYHLARNVRIDKVRAAAGSGTGHHHARPPERRRAAGGRRDRDQQSAILRRALARLPEDKRNC